MQLNTPPKQYINFFESGLGLKAIRALMISTSLMMSASLMLSGCQKTDNGSTELPNVQILEDEVIVVSSLIMTSNPERYQPSYTLEGALIPVDFTAINTPFSADNITLYVKKGERVEKGQILATIDTSMSDANASSIDSRYIEVMVDGIRQNPTRSDSSKEAALIKEATSVKEATLIKDNTPNGEASNDVSRAYTSSAASKSSQNTQSSKDSRNNNDSSKSTTHSVSTNAVDTVKNLPEKEPSTIHKNNNGSLNAEFEVTLIFKSPIKGTIININEELMASLESLSQASQTSPAKTSPAKTSALKTLEAQNLGPQTSDNSKSSQIHSSQDSANTLANTSAKTSIKPQDKANTQQSIVETNMIDAADTAASKPLKLSHPLNKDMTLLTVGDTHKLQLVGRLPLTAESELSVGDSVNFKVFEAHSEFTGQISHITPVLDEGYLVVRAPLLSEDDDKAILEPGMLAIMSIDYGQKQLGVRLPKEGIFEADLSKLNAKHPRPTEEIHGYVWVIEQDQHLSYTPVKVIEYFAQSDKYLVHGINNDSVVCLADLPKDSAGKLISVE